VRLGSPRVTPYHSRMMLRALLCLFVTMTMLAGTVQADAPAADVPPPDAPLSAQGKSEARQTVLDKLYEQLAAAPDEATGRALESAIQSVWLESGSPSIDLLMRRGLDALREENYDRAYFYFDEVVTLAPGFAEGWNKRATIHYIRDDYARALRDIEQVLRLQPRHFEALAGLGVILEELGDKKGALDAYRKAVEIDPWLLNGMERIRPLELDVEGRGI